MHLSAPSALYLLCIVPLFIVFQVIIFSRKRKAMALFAQEPLFTRLAPTLSLRRQKVKIFLTVIALIFLIISLSGPQWGEREREVTSRGTDIFIALDCSLSMEAEDYKPSRLGLAKTILKKITEKLQGNRMGVIAFAGKAYVECPLTVDISAVNMYIDDLSHSTIPVQGTSIGDAITTAMDFFPKDEKAVKVLILLTDGEDLEGKAKQAALEAAKKNIRIFTLGIGSEKGCEIPVEDEKEKKTGPKIDKNGKVVLSCLDEKALRDIARITGGKYCKCSYNEQEINEISNSILQMEKRNYQSFLQKQYVERFQYPLALAFIILAVEPFISETRVVRKNGQ